MSGREFREMVGDTIRDDRGEKLVNFHVFSDLIVEQLCVLHSIQPNEKYLLIIGLKQLGKVVATTGMALEMLLS